MDCTQEVSFSEEGGRRCLSMGSNQPRVALGGVFVVRGKEDDRMEEDQRQDGLMSGLAVDHDWRGRIPAIS